MGAQTKTSLRMTENRRSEIKILWGKFVTADKEKKKVEQRRHLT